MTFRRAKIAEPDLSDLSATVNRLENWARYMNARRGAGHCASAEWRYSRSNDPDRYVDDAPKTSVQRCDANDAGDIDRIVSKLPTVSFRLLVGGYIERMDAFQACKYAKIQFSAYASEFRRAVICVRDNR